MSELIGILGPTALRIDGALTDAWGTPRQRAFLGALALYAGKWMTVGQLAEWVWPEEARLPQSPPATLHNLATKVRKSLRRIPTVADISGKNGRYRLEVDRDVIDYHRFRRLIQQCRTNPAQAIETAADALALSRGPFLEDLPSDAAAVRRAKFDHDELLPAHAHLVEALLAADRCDDALAHIDDIETEHPLHFRLARLRLTALHRLGRTEDETQYYITIRNRLLDSGDDAAANHLREHHEHLREHGGRLREAAAAVKTAPPEQIRPSAFPFDPPDFSGREDLLSRLDAAATAGDGQLLRGVVVLDGMPGVGKTALAVRWGHRVRHRFSGGDLFVPLNGYSSDSPARHHAVVDELLTALGQHLDNNVPARAREVMLRERLAGRHTLVVLDNARNTEHVKNLVPLLADCLVVITSRQRLSTLTALTGARRVSVPPMSTAESRDLLTASLGRRTPVSIDRLTDLCGGLPLVLNLAASHLAEHFDTWPPEHLPESSARSLLLESGEDGDGADSPETVFGWSYHGQTDRDRRLFRRLALLPGPEFGPQAAAVCADLPTGDVRAALNRLVGANLLERHGDRYRLHDLLRHYAARCLTRDEPDEHEPANQRMVAYYLASTTRANRVLYPNDPSAPPLPGQDEVVIEAIEGEADAKEWFRRERVNIIAVIGLAANAGHHGHAWRIAHAASIYLGRHGFHVDTRLVREAAVTAAKADGHREAEAASLSDLGLSHITFGDLDEAYHCFNFGRRYAQETGDLLAKSRTAFHMGRIEIMRGNPGAAVDLLRESLDAARRLEDRLFLGFAHSALGDALRAMSRLEEAKVQLFHARFYAETVDDPSAMADCMAKLGAVFRDEGEFRSAAGHCAQALLIIGASDQHMVAKINVDLADIYHAAGMRDLAERHARQAITLATDINDVPARASALDALGAVLRAQGEPVKAAEVWSQALDLHLRMNDAHRAALIQSHLVELSGAIPDTRRPVRSDFLDQDRL
ncbi:AfsR/SARP family transcriptional regulator [Actinokineospora sp. 24-640]